MQGRVRLAPRRRVALGVLCFGLLAGAASEGCRTPTQVTVELRTFGALPCTSLKGVAIVIAHAPQDAEDKMALRVLSAEVPRGVCDADGHTIGTIVVTPSTSTGAIVVAARFSEDASASCKPPDYKGCIVARRSFSFIDHVSVTLPISLDVACVDVPCGVVTSCRAGTCVPSEAQCSESSGTCDSAAEPVLLPDGGSAPPDGALGDAPLGDAPLGDAPSDAPREGDATVDAPEAGTSFGNLCPRALLAMGPTDCFPMASASYCCRGASGYFCGMPGASCQPGDDKFQCTGRLHCNVPAGQFCCGSDPGLVPRSSTCSTSCTSGGDHFLCNTSDDCPPGQVCTGIYDATPPGGPLRQCGPGPVPP